MAVSRADFDKIYHFWTENFDSHMSQFFEHEDIFACSIRVLSISPSQLQKLNELLPQLGVVCEFEKREENGETILEFS